MTVITTEEMYPRHDGSRAPAHRHQMTASWKDDVRAALKERGVSEQWLADQITLRRGLKRPMKRDSINKMLRKQDHSSLVPDVCAILGLQPPMIETPPLPDDETKRAVELVLNAPADVRDAVLLLLRGHGKSD